MSRQDEARLQDIVEAIDAIRSHLTRGGLSDGLVHDAVRIRLNEIGETVKGIDTDILDAAPEVPWKEIAACETTSHIATSTRITPSCKTSSTTTSVHSLRPCSR